MSIVITINQKGARLDVIEKLVSAAVQTKYPNAYIQAVRKERPESRSQRFEEAKSWANDASSAGEELRDELQDWLDNLPEGLQGGDRASMLEEAISQLDEFVNYCDDASNVDVEFPGMYS